jgi:preprotein translocase subunit SecA
MDKFIPPKSVEEMWDVDGLAQTLERDFAARLDIKGWLAADTNLGEEQLRKRIVDEINQAYEAKVQHYGVPVMRHVEKAIMLQQVDSHWREHLAAMDYLRQGIHLRSYAQKNPKQEYKREAFELFTALLDRVKYDTVSLLSRMQLRTQADIDAEEEARQRRLARAMQFQHAAPEQVTASPPPSSAEPEGPASPAPVAQFVRDTRKVGRNEPCPCGSGKKYKHCHGALAGQG